MLRSSKHYFGLEAIFYPSPFSTLHAGRRVNSSSKLARKKIQVIKHTPVPEQIGTIRSTAWPLSRGDEFNQPDSTDWKQAGLSALASVQ